MKNKLAIAAVAAAVAIPAFGADSYTIDPRHTFPSWEISHFGWSTQRGRFNKVTGKIVLDRVAKTGTVEVTIDAASLDTGLEKLEEHLRSEDFFNVGKHPTITFRSKKVRFDGDRPVAVDGDFTLLGVTGPVTLTIDAFQCAMNPYAKREVCGADATTTIKRSEFGMTKLLPGLGDEVRLIISGEALKD